jgi:energy-coupling factor transporter transmembrane protein EcfT
MSPLERLGLPVKDFFHTMGLTLQCFPVLKNMAAQTYREETRNADIRGFWDKAKVVSSFLLPLFVRSVQSPELFFDEAKDNAE